MPKGLPHGAYDHPLTRALARAAGEVEAPALVELDELGSEDVPERVGRHVAAEVARLHWETQGRTSVRSTGRRYIESPANGWTFHMFVGAEPDSPLAYVGPVVYVSHEGDQPIAITWRLTYPLSGSLYDRFRTLAQG